MTVPTTPTMRFVPFVAKAVAESYGLTVPQLFAPSGDPIIGEAMQAAYWLCHKFLGLEVSLVAKALDCDRKSVERGIEQAAKRKSARPLFYAAIRRLSHRLKGEMKRFDPIAGTLEPLKTRKRKSGGHAHDLLIGDAAPLPERTAAE